LGGWEFDAICTKNERGRGKKYLKKQMHFQENIDIIIELEDLAA
jgi:hypothetical protein